ncbi:MAG: hypothetical protein RL354_1347, partial [Planctomycetota bacterium]
ERKHRLTTVEEVVPPTDLVDLADLLAEP